MTIAGPLTVGLATSSFLPAQGGAEIGLHNIALQLLEKGHQPIVISGFTHARALQKGGWKIPYKLVSYPPRLLTWLTSRPSLGAYGLRWFHGLVQRRYGIDVWHATFGYPIGVAVIEFCKPRKIAHLVRCVGEDIQIKPEIGYGMRLNPRIDAEVRRWLPKAQRLIAITESVVEEYRSLGVIEERIARIPNGIDLQRFKAHTPKSNMRAHLGISPSTCIFLALGRQHPKKNFAQLIEAAASLRSRSRTPFAVIIAGRGVTALSPVVSKEGVGDIVHLCEPDAGAGGCAGVRQIKLPSDEILDYYAVADMFVMPSLIETFGIVTIEAMASGLPVIAANSPGSRDIIRGSRDGVLYDGSLDSLTRAMADWLDNKSSRSAYATKSRVRAEDFNWANIVDLYVEEYSQLIKEYR